MEIKTLLSKRNFTSMNNKKNQYIVIHYVGAISSALANTKYFENQYRGASAHYFVDDKDIYQVVKDKDASWHCGAKYYKHLSCRNSNSIGIEMCCYKNSKGQLDVSETVINKTIELVKELMKKYNIPVQNVLRHYDITGKNCPAPLVTDNSRWIKFKERLEKQEEKLTKYKQGDFVEVDIPINIAYDNGGDKVIVDSNGYQFWAHKSVIKNNHIKARALVCFAYNNDLYMLQIFEDENAFQFNCKIDYITKKL